VVLGSIITILGVSAYHRSHEKSFSRGLETDEYITLQNYTWAGVTSDGTRRELRRLSDIEQLKTPSAKEFMVGVYCSLGRWTEPNNHVIYSLIADGALALSDRKTVALRLPALLAAVAFAVGVAVVCWRCKWYATSVAAGTIAFWNPYVVQYSQQGRGYTLMLFLVVLFLIGCEKAVKNPTSIPVCSALVLISVFIFENTVNMAVDWVIPCYILLIAFPGLFAPVLATEQGTLRRKSLVIQVLCIGLAGFIFLMDRLPYVYSSMQQYGIPFRTPSDFFELLQNHLHYLFPSPSLATFALIGCVGMGLAWRERPGRGFVTLSIVAMLASLLHFAASNRFAYERNLGYYLVPVLLGYACLGQRLITLPRRLWQRVASGTLLYLGTLAFLVAGHRPPVTDLAYEALRARIRASSKPSDTPSLALLGEGVDSSISLDFPAAWSDTGIPEVPGSAVNLLLVERKAALPPVPRPENRSAIKSLPNWPKAEIVAQDGVYSIVRLPCRVEGLRQKRSAEKAIVLWYPSFDSVAVSPEKVLWFLEESRLLYHPITGRYQAKLDVFGRLMGVVVAESTTAATRRLWDTLDEAERRFGGRAIVLIPRDA
jgi:hypothetical protein